MGYFVVLYFSSSGPLSQDGNPNFIIIKSSQYWFSLGGFSRGIYVEIKCANAFGFVMSPSM
jgi:hypothetical protein